MRRGLDRGVSESAGVAILLVVTLLVTASVGVGVLVAEDDADGPRADFSFEYKSDAGLLLVRHDGGDAIPAADLLVEGPPGEFTWATLAGANESANVTEGDPIQLTDSGEWNDPVSNLDTVRVYYAPSEGNRTQLAVWNE